MSFWKGMKSVFDAVDMEFIGGLVAIVIVSLLIIFAVTGILFFLGVSR